MHHDIVCVCGETELLADTSWSLQTKSHIDSEFGVEIEPNDALK